MGVLLDWRCPKCEALRWGVVSSRECPERCERCGARMRITWEGGQAPSTDLFGAPRRFDCAQGEFSGSRELQKHMKTLGYEHAGDPVGGARKDHRLTRTGYSYSGQRSRTSTAERS